MMRGVYFLPSLATLGNAICGFGALYVTTLDPGRESDPFAKLFAAHALLWAAYLVFAAGVFDVLDGRLARLTRHTTDFGGQLDSLADVISFGVAPAFVALQLFKTEGPTTLPVGVSRLVWAMGALYMACAAMRLARFNVTNEHGEQHHRSFQGLPSPGAGLGVLSFVLLHYELASRFGNANWAAKSIAYLVPFVLLACGLLMVSEVRYPHMLNTALRGRKSLWKLVVGLAVFLMLIVEHNLTVATACIGFVLMGPAYWLRVRHQFRRGRQSDDPAVALSPPDSPGIIARLMPDRVVTRFAPSPTGYLHVGGARTALFNWLLARHTGGQFLLRIEDTDLARSTDDAVRQLVEDLTWLNLKWDNEHLVYQSKRLGTYNAIIDGLLTKGQAYEAWETPDELDALRETAKKAKRAYLYKRTNYSADQLARFRDEGRRPVIRFAMPAKEYRFADVVAGREIVQSAFESQDFVIRKTDGMPTYHFGVVVDDAEMGITHVLRGLEHLKNTFNHVALQEALGYDRPIYAHLSVMLDPQSGEKLSKRDRDRRIRRRVGEWMRSSKRTVADLSAACGFAPARLNDWLDNETSQLDLSEQPRVMQAVGLKETDLPEIMVHDFRKNGYTPDVLLNFLALQGWSPGHDLEQMSVATMVEKFGLDRIISSNPKFNRDKLKAFQTDAFSAMTPEQVLAAARDWLTLNPRSPLNDATDEQLAQLLAMNKGFHVLGELDEKCAFFFLPDDAIAYDAKAVDKVLRKDDNAGLNALREMREAFAGLAVWTHEIIETNLIGHATARGLQIGKLAQPLRVAVSGGAVSPPIFETLAFLGQSHTLARIDRCLSLNG